ncbi:MAG: AAA family ATPase, partial [Ghiorsea sp.]
LSIVKVVDSDQMLIKGKVKHDELAKVSSFDNKVIMRETTLNLVPANSIKMERIEWLWHHFLARGKLHIFAGQAGTGKTTIALNMAATVTKGGLWADGTQAPSGSVLIWSGEDDPADSLIPRLTASGANLDKVYFIGDIHSNGESRSFDPSSDMPYLLAAAEKVADLSLVIVDPIVSAVAGDSHKNAEVRKSLQPLVDMGMKANAAILGITHFSKGSKGSDPAERVTGSLAFGALARLVMCTVKPMDEDDKPRFIRAKSNISPDGGGFEYELKRKDLEEGIEGQYIEWGKALEGTATELMSDIESGDSNGSALEDAARLLSGCLEDGCQPFEIVRKDMSVHNVSAATLKRARKYLDVESLKATGGKYGGKWFLKLPYHPWNYEGEVLAETKSSGSSPECEPLGTFPTQEISNSPKIKWLKGGQNGQVVQANEPVDFDEKKSSGSNRKLEPLDAISGQKPSSRNKNKVVQGGVNQVVQANQMSHLISDPKKDNSERKIGELGDDGKVVMPPVIEDQIVTDDRVDIAV